MSRRNQSSRRRSYGRRQHEVRERRPAETSDMPWLEEAESGATETWPQADAADDQASFGEASFGEAFGGYAR